MHRAIILLGLCVFSFPAGAVTQKIFVNSGTGFFVTSGQIVTNLHVVSYCQRIVVQGAVSPRIAKVIGRDQTHDLALLEVEAMGNDVGSLRGHSLPLTLGERVLVIGYPGEAAKTGKTVTREAQVTNLKGPMGEDTWMQLSDMVEQGNSGGPLLDEAGNVIGVIAARAVIYTYPTSDPRAGTYTNSGIAISQSKLESFLEQYHVRYRFSDAISNLSADRLTEKAQRFVVNVRCETATEIR